MLKYKDSSHALERRTNGWLHHCPACGWLITIGSDTTYPFLEEPGCWKEGRLVNHSLSTFFPVIQGLSIQSSEQQYSLRNNQIWSREIWGLISAPSGSYPCLGQWQDAQGEEHCFHSWLFLRLARSSGGRVLSSQSSRFTVRKGANCIHLLVLWQGGRFGQLK